MKHKHYDLIVAWANGGQLQYRSTYDDVWIDIAYASWDQDGQYRIKPEPKPKPKEYYDEDTFDVQYLYVYNHTIEGKSWMSPTFMQEYGLWNYMGKVRIEK
jgi:hypothetical protein